MKNWCDMIIFSSICHYASCTILNSAGKYIESFLLNLTVAIEKYLLPKHYKWNHNLLYMCVLVYNYKISKWAEQSSKVMRQNERWNTLQTYPCQDVNSGGWDLWTIALLFTLCTEMLIIDESGLEKQSCITKASDNYW